jgi:hypothetical protein
MLAKISGLETVGGGVDGSRQGCRKCGLAHGGGNQKCPLKGLSPVEAQKRMSQFLRKMGKMSNEAAAKFLSNDSGEE